jgi:hypothetical protein
MAGTPARSRSLHIAGTAGYLSEWQFDGEVAETATSGELVGPLVWKHIGLCSVNGPQEKPGKIHVRFSGAGSPSMRQFYLTARGALIAEPFRAARKGAWTDAHLSRLFYDFIASSIASCLRGGRGG